MRSAASSRESLIMRPGRRRDIAKWVGTLLSLLIFAGWVASVPIMGHAGYSITRYGPINVVTLQQGSLYWWHNTRDVGSRSGWYVCRTWGKSEDDPTGRYAFGMRLPLPRIMMPNDWSILPLW